jgi:hypothetical protein
MQRCPMNTTLNIDIRKFTHADQINKILTLGLHRHVQSTYLIVKTQNIWVDVGIQK